MVEPFLHLGSLLGVSLGSGNEKIIRTKRENTVKLTQIFDETEWVGYASNYGYSPLVSWEHFIHHAPRRLMVDKACISDSQKCMQCSNGFTKKM